ncbi:MAG: LytTR family transcriptional regulator DNA-binding domain-containing protein, partial [Lachnospiraceae bacterium]|nr:LytTR family transcriptional regulator DNA-binding domain-containing protein [Lachnospiraceae bacterium]
ESSTIRTRMPLKELLTKLSPVFLKISRINIVNMSKIARFSERDAFLLDGRSLPVPAKKMTEIRQTVTDFFNFNSW